MVEFLERLGFICGSATLDFQTAADSQAYIFAETNSDTTYFLGDEVDTRLPD
jgi:hypothetical protein